MRRLFGSKHLASVAVLGLVASACGASGSSPSEVPTVGPSEESAAPSSAAKGEVVFGVDLALQGSSLAAAQPILNGFQLAVDDSNAAGGANGWNVELLVQDDTVQGNPDAQQGAQNAQAFVGNPAVVGMLGPYNSGIALAQIPITNEGGLLQCSPSNTNERLTKPEYGALDLRKAFPERIAYVRTVTADDVLAPAAARYAYDSLGKRKALVIDDTSDAADAADRFQTEFERLGGTVIREGLPATTSDYTSSLTAAQAEGVDVAYFAGVTATGGGLLRRQMGQVGMDIPLLSGDGIQDGTAETDGSYNNIAGEAANGSFSTVAAITEIPDREAFNAKYRDEFGEDPGAYSATAYACAQVLLAGLAAAQATDTAEIREELRAHVTDPANTFETVTGEVSFDENGDTTQRVISIFESQNGEWVFREQQIFE